MKPEASLAAETQSCISKQGHRLLGSRQHALQASFVDGSTRQVSRCVFVVCPCQDARVRAYSCRSEGPRVAVEALETEVAFRLFGSLISPESAR